MCEEFHCTPTDALQQDLSDCLAIMELRAYADMKHRIDTSEHEDDVPSSPLADAVMNNYAITYRQRLKERTGSV